MFLPTVIDTDFYSRVRGYVRNINATAGACASEYKDGSCAIAVYDYDILTT